MSREPHGPVRRLSMLIVAFIWITIGGSLAYITWPDDHIDEPRQRRRYTSRAERRREWFWPGVGMVITFVGLRFIYTAVTPYRPRTQEEEDAEGEEYTWEERRRLRQWGD